MNQLLSLSLAASLSLSGIVCCAPAMAAQPAAPAPADRLEEGLGCMVTVVLPALQSVSDKASADAAVTKLEQAIPHLQLITHVLTAELTPEEERRYLPVIAPRMKQLLAQLDTCCRLSAEMLSSKPQAYGSERLALALTALLDTFMYEQGQSDTKGRTLPQDVPLALAEADAQVAAMHALLASLERLQSPEAVAAELPAIREQIAKLRALQQGLADSTRWSRTQLFLIMQRMKQRGGEASTDLGKCVAHLMGLEPSCYGSAELEALLGSLINSPAQ